MEFKYLEEECVEERPPIIGKKGKRIIAGVILVLMLVLVVRVIRMFGTQAIAAASIKILEKNFYSMDYEGNYGFDEFLEGGGAETDEELIDYIVDSLYHNMYNVEINGGKYGCSTLRARTGDGEGGAVLFGRNFDYKDCKSMVVTTTPKDGYKSISTCDLDFLGIDSDWEPKGFLNRMMAVAAVYVPVDGMNEKGVCIAVLTISDGTVTDQNTDKPDITTTTAVRMVLDKTASVDEAVEMLRRHDMHSSISGQFKFAITDSTGKSVVVEYIKNEMFVTEVDACSNYYQTPGEYYGIGIPQPCPRYEKLMDAYKNSDGVMTEDELMNAMESASQKYFYHNHTQWTIVFNTKNKTATYCYHEDFEEKYFFELE